MMRGEMKSKSVIDFDEVGLLRNPDTWSEYLAEQIARQDGIGELTDAHWKIIFSLRDQCARRSTVPAMRSICASLGMSEDSAQNLFHTCMEAWRVAGISDPDKYLPRKPGSPEYRQ
jgi:dissimilatory sulfite reductase related protein